MRSSSAALHKRWGVRTGQTKLSSKKSTYIQFLLNDKLRRKLKRELPGIPLLADAEVTAEQLGSFYEALIAVSKSQSKSLNAAQKTLLEECRLSVMLALHKHLEQYVWKAKSVPDTNKKQSRFWKKAKVVLLFSFSVIKLAQTIFTEFIGFKSILLLLIPAMANPIVLGIAFGMTVISVILFFATQASMFRSKFGISLARNLKYRFEIYNDEIRVTEKINSMLGNLNTRLMTRQEYGDCADLAIKFNRRMAVKKEKFSKYKEHPAKKAFRYGVLGFGAIMMAAGSYFGAVALLTAVASTLVGTPVGWIIIGLLIATSLVFYFSMRDDAMVYLLNPIKQQFDKVNKRIKKFCEIDEGVFATLTEKAVFKNEDKTSKKLRRLDSSSSASLDESDEESSLETISVSGKRRQLDPGYKKDVQATCEHKLGVSAADKQSERPARRGRSLSMSAVPIADIPHLRGIKH